MVLPDSDGISRVPPYSGYIQERTKFRLRGCYPLRRTFRSLRLPRSFVTPYRMSTTPRGKPLGLGYVPFRSPLLRKSHLLSLPPYLDVSVPGSVFLTLCIQVRIPYHYVWWVSPFGNLRIKAYLQLPEAYRR